MDDAKIRELLTRGVERIFPSAEFLEKELKSGRRLSVYLGIDPTGPTLHLGHVIPMLKLRRFQELGHRVIVLIGDFTATIGDPTGKLESRPVLTRKEARENARYYRKQAESIITFSGDNAAELTFNSTWLERMPLRETSELFRSVTYAQIIKRDMFQRRMEAGEDLFAHEMLYPLFQAYDSVVLGVDGEIGGNDQMYNMLMGRDLVKKMKNREKFVIAMKLLVDPTGKKMGKTEGNMVAFSDASSDAFGKVMSWPDTMIITGFELCTIVSVSDIEHWKKRLEGGENPKEAKLALAEAVVSLLHSEREAREAQASFNAAFSERKPKDFIEILRSHNPMGVLIEKGIIASRTELRRLIAAGAITSLDSDTKVGEDFAVSFPAGKYRIGKHRFIAIK